MSSILWLIVIALVVFWVIGAFAVNFGNVVHILLVVVVILVAYNLLVGRRGIR